MKSYLKKSIALILSLMMTLSMMPSMVFAVDEQAAANVESTQEAAMAAAHPQAMRTI